MPERLFDNHSPPMPVFLVREPGLAQLLHDLREELGRGRQIEQIIRVGIVVAVHAGEPVGQRRISGGIGEVSALIVKPLGEPLPRFRAAVFFL